MKPGMKVMLGGITVFTVCAILISACSATKIQAPAVAAAQPNTLTAVKTDLPPVLDGSGDDLVWQVASPRVLDATPDGIPAFQVTLKSAYDDENIYFLVQYPDKNMDVIRAAWVFNPDTKAWERMDDSLGDEDEWGFYWNNNVPNYEVKGCQGLCHDEDPNNQKMYTPTGTWVDIWQFNGVRSAPMNWMRDMRLTDDPEASESGGFVEDEGSTTNPGYVDNLQTLDGKDVPLYWKPYSGAGGVVTGSQIFLLQSEIDSGDAKKIVSVDVNGVMKDEDGNDVPWYARIPGRILSAPSGPSWNDIHTTGTWLNGVWTIEVSRKLKTGHADDVQFDTTQPYYFDIYIKTRQAGETSRQIVTVSKFVFAH